MSARARLTRRRSESREQKIELELKEEQRTPSPVAVEVEEVEDVDLLHDEHTWAAQDRAEEVEMAWTRLRIRRMYELLPGREPHKYLDVSTIPEPPKRPFFQTTERVPNEEDLVRQGSLLEQAAPDEFGKRLAAVKRSRATQSRWHFSPRGPRVSRKNAYEAHKVLTRPISPVPERDDETVGHSVKELRNAVLARLSRIHSSTAVDLDRGTSRPEVEDLQEAWGPSPTLYRPKFPDATIGHDKHRNFLPRHAADEAHKLEEYLGAETDDKPDLFTTVPSTLDRRGALPMRATPPSWEAKQLRLSSDEPGPGQYDPRNPAFWGQPVIPKPVRASSARLCKKVKPRPVLASASERLERFLAAERELANRVKARREELAEAERQRVFALVHADERRIAKMKEHAEREAALQQLQQAQRGWLTVMAIVARSHVLHNAVTMHQITGVFQLLQERSLDLARKAAAKWKRLVTRRRRERAANVLQQWARARLRTKALKRKHDRELRIGPPTMPPALKRNLARLRARWAARQAAEEESQRNI